MKDITDSLDTLCGCARQLIEVQKWQFEALTEILAAQKVAIALLAKIADQTAKGNGK